MSPPIHTACIIDDDRTFVFIVNHMIRANQLCEEVLAFENGQVAIDRLRALAEDGAPFPEIIFLDINMPVLDGWGFLDEFRSLRDQLPRKVRIYMATSSIDDRDLERSRTYEDVTDFINKPIRPDTLTLLFRGD